MLYVNRSFLLDGIWCTNRYNPTPTPLATTLDSQGNLLIWLITTVFFLIRSSPPKPGTESECCTVLKQWQPGFCWQGSWWQQRLELSKRVLRTYHITIWSLVEGRPGKSVHNRRCTNYQCRETRKRARWCWNLDWKVNRDQWPWKHEVKTIHKAPNN